MFEYAIKIYGRRELLKHMVLTNLKAGHRDKLLGNVWFLLDPLLQMGVYYLVFGVFFGLAKDPVSYLIYLFSGILFLSFFTGTIQFSAESIRRSAGLILSNYFPLGVIPLSILLFRLYDLMCGLIVLFTVLLFTKYSLSWHLVWLPPLLGLFSLFTLGLAFLVAVIGVFFADLSNILSFVLRLLFYLSPVMYTIDRIPEDWRHIYMLNPFAVFLKVFRNLILDHSVPEARDMAFLVGVSLISFVIGFWVVSRKESKLAKYI